MFIKENVARLGEIQRFVVDRQTDLGVMLKLNDEQNPEDYLFLHHNEMCGANPLPGQIIDAYVYVDKKGRPAATLRTPTMTCSKGGMGQVVEVSPSSGCFVSYGPSKDALYSKDDLPKKTSEWPQVGSIIPGFIKVHGGKLLIRPMNKPEMLALEKDSKLNMGEKVKGYVYRITDAGINVVTDDFHIIFVHSSLTNNKHYLGECVSPKIMKINDDDYNGSLLLSKEEAYALHQETIEKAKQDIISYLEQHDNMMTITDKTSDMIIKKVFDMSKSVFKEALGNLYKNKIIFIADDRVILL